MLPPYENPWQVKEAYSQRATFVFPIQGQDKPLIFSLMEIVKLIPQQRPQANN